MNIKDGIVHPLTILGTSSKPISTVEQRQYLYDQDRKIEKLIRSQGDVSNYINSFINSRENKIQSILNYQSSQNSSYLEAIEDLGWGISNGIHNIFDGLKKMDENQIEMYKKEMEALGIINYNLNEGFFVVNENLNEGFNNLLLGIKEQTIVLHDILVQIGNIIDTLHNPRKIEGLEYKRDAIEYLEKEWNTEALEYFYLASEKLTTDQEVFYLIGLIEFEYNKNYIKATESLEKAIKYSKGYDDKKVYIQSLDKLSSIIFINHGGNQINLRKAYEFQLEAVNVNNKVNQNHLYDLLKYSAIIGEYETFEYYLYILLIENPSLILEISANKIFTKNNNLIEIIDKVIKKIKQENEQEIKEKERLKYLENLEKEKKYITNLQKSITDLEKENGIVGELLYIDGGVIIIGNKEGEITNFISYNNDFSEVNGLFKNFKLGGYKYIKKFGNSKNSLYSLSDLSSINGEKKGNLLIIDSKLGIYCDISGNIHINYDIEEGAKSVYFGDFNKNILEGGITKCALPNNTKVKNKSDLKLLKLGNRINFKQPNGEILFQFNCYGSLLEKYRELEKYIDNNLIECFNIGIGKIKILNEIYKVERKPNVYGYFDYKIYYN